MARLFSIGQITILDEKALARGQMSGAAPASSGQSQAAFVGGLGAVGGAVAIGLSKSDGGSSGIAGTASAFVDGSGASVLGTASDTAQALVGGGVTASDFTGITISPPPSGPPTIIPPVLPSSVGSAPSVGTPGAPAAGTAPEPTPTPPAAEDPPPPSGS